MIKFLLIISFFMAGNAFAQNEHFVRKQIEPSFFVPKNINPQVKKLATPKYGQGEVQSIKSIHSSDNVVKRVVAEPQPIDVLVDVAAYKKKYGEYNKDLEQIKDTGELPNNPSLNNDLAEMNSNEKKVVPSNNDFVPLF